MTLKRTGLGASSSSVAKAIARGKAFWATEPRAVKARYAANRDEVDILLDNGVRICIPRRLLQGLESAPKRKVSALVLEDSGTGLSWPLLDVEHYVPGLLRGVFGTLRWMAKIGQKGGVSRSRAKVRASRANGMKGGRPRKVS